MPEMGKPVTANDRAFANVTMAPRKQSNLSPDKIAAKEKERLINNITGYKEKNDLYKDAKTHNKMGKDEFLRLLTVQLENQDPMNPMEQGKMAAELAQFSSLEQLSNINKNFENLSNNKHIEDKFYGASFLGKEVVTSGSSLKFAGEGTKADILFTLPEPADKVLVRIFDSKRNMVGEVWKENIGRGNQTFTWDGMQLDGAYSGKGDFTTAVFAWDNNADPIEVKTKNTGVVESVFFENGETVLMVEGKKVFLRDVDSFHTPGALQRGQAKVQKGPQVNVGAAMESAVPSQSAQRMMQANNSAPKLPLASKNTNSVNLNKMNNLNGMKAYKEQEPTTGITNIYDVE